MPSRLSARTISQGPQVRRFFGCRGLDQLSIPAHKLKNINPYIKTYLRSRHSQSSPPKRHMVYCLPRCGGGGRAPQRDRYCRHRCRTAIARRPNGAKLKRPNWTKRAGARTQVGDVRVTDSDSQAAYACRPVVKHRSDLSPLCAVDVFGLICRRQILDVETLDTDPARQCDPSACAQSCAGLRHEKPEPSTPGVNVPLPMRPHPRSRCFLGPNRAC
jgi:hypothetical protein